MAKKIIWSLNARDQRKEILAYWKKRNKSVAYSMKLNDLFKEAILMITRFPEIGKKTTTQNVRMKMVRAYAIVYEATSTAVHIISIWDSNQDEAGLAMLISE